MFKNPLKYQQGGSVQDAMQQLVAWLVQNTGLDEGQVSQRLSQILSDDTAKQELVNNLQNMQKGDQEAAEKIKSMFVPQSAKLGGKIQDFICKHGKGGKAGCGCQKAQNGTTFRNSSIDANQFHNEKDFILRNSQSIAPPIWQQELEKHDPSFRQNHFNNVRQIANASPNNIDRGMFWSAYRALHRMPNPVNVPSQPMNNRVQGPEEKLAGMENGGKVAKAQGGSGSMWGPVYTDNNGRWRNFYDEYNGAAGTVNMNTGRAYRAGTDEEMLQPGRYNRRGYPIAEGASTNGTWYEVTPRGGIVVNIPEGGQQVLHGSDSTGVANLINQWDQSKVGHAVTAKENGGNLKKKKENANVEMHQQKNKGRGKLSTPVSTTPKDSSKVEYNPSMQTLSFEDENGNNVTWTRNNFWGKPDGTYNWRSGRDMMFFNPNQNDGFIPYNKFKQWNTGIEGSTYLSPEDDARLKNLYEYARNKRTYIEPHYSWDNSIAERFWYWLKSLNRDKELTPGAPTFWEQTFKNGGNIVKAQNGDKSLYEQITADGPETYTDGYGTVREMNESPIITGLRKAYHWINGDRSLSDEAYLQKHGYAKPIIGMPPAVTPMGKVNPAELERVTARAAGWGAVSDAIAEILPGWAMAGAAAIAKDEIDKRQEQKSKNAENKKRGGQIEKGQGGTKISLFTNTLKRIPPRIYSSNPLNPSNSWRFIVENFDKEHPDSSIIAPRVMGGEHIYTRTYDQFGIPHTTVNDNSLQFDASEIFNIYRDAQKALQEDNNWGQPNTTYNVK